MIHADPTTLGKKQDLHLQVAAKLAKMHIPDKFYEEIYQRGSHKFLSGAEHARQAAINEEAIIQLESIAYRSRSPIEIDRQRRNRIPYLERKQLRQYPGLCGCLDKTDEEEFVRLDEEIKALEHASQQQQASSTPAFYIHPRIDSEFIGPRWLTILASSLVGGNCGNTTAADAMQLCYALADGEFEHLGAVEWGDVPSTLRRWLQEQDGLQSDGVPIASVRDLLRVHGLIFKRPAIREEDLKASIMKIFVAVARRYYHLLAYAARDSSFDHLIIRGTEPLALKCSNCQLRLLDDPFPRFKKSDKNRYVGHHLKRGCGSEASQQVRKPGFAVPCNSQFTWAARKTVVSERPPMKAD
ncbi:hypothetical protein X797_007588 [Metarhizium robertsii]|uniref:Uncharacterized protein n=2 Tax=Metarhizium robertsii TaxID=568076 RepID=E9F5F2_METRA|nr:uncharacterized protein MAA_07501 [Metarhizium robertsii ARSEF 23]EFY96955.1 hypothetical protein MAA_07501 [Metarhizium robertsii ARSEF 23]EXU99451.1 hypothetical protein X797_007588 [Metarhizium robertsii]